MRARLAILVVVATLVSRPARTQGTPPAPKPACDDAAHAQFDFWLGRWDVADSAGASLGSSEITRELGGCLVRERWNAGTPWAGESLSAYDRVARAWHQTWIDGAGNVWKTDGGLVGGSMVLTRTGPGPRGPEPLLHRWTWTPADADHVRQRYEVSADGGATWTTRFDGRYTRRRG